MTTSPSRTRSAPEDVVGLDDADAGAGDVVVVGRHEARGARRSRRRRARSRPARSRPRCRRRSRRCARGRPARRRCSPAGTAARRRRRRGRRRPCRRGRCRPCRACPSPARWRAWCRRRRCSRRAAAPCTCEVSRRNSPAKPPSPPTTSGRLARVSLPFISSTARSPASMSTPGRGVRRGRLARRGVRRVAGAAHGRCSASPAPAPGSSASSGSAGASPLCTTVVPARRVLVLGACGRRRVGRRLGVAPGGRCARAPRARACR